MCVVLLTDLVGVIIVQLDGEGERFRQEAKQYYLKKQREAMLYEGRRVRQERERSLQQKHSETMQQFHQHNPLQQQSGVAATTLHTSIRGGSTSVLTSLWGISTHNAMFRRRGCDRTIWHNRYNRATNSGVQPAELSCNTCL